MQAVARMGLLRYPVTKVRESTNVTGERDHTHEQHIRRLFDEFK